jgi:DNA uptake protein ComE-like DNA-binding protein
MRWKEFLYLQRESKVAVILLLILIMLTLMFSTFVNSVNSSEIVLRQNDSIKNEFKSLSAQRLTVAQSEKHVNSQQSLDSKDSVSNRSINRDVVNQRKYTNDNYVRIVKLSEGETISLNSTDTTEWKKIPGIGSSYSSRIVKYRTLLGGFVCKDQLQEVYGIDSEMYARISPFIAEDTNWSKIKINKLEFKELLRHPYLNYNQVKVIMNLRDKKGNITSIDELSMLDEFSKDDISRLQPYLEF